MKSARVFRVRRGVVILAATVFLAVTSILATPASLDAQCVVTSTAVTTNTAGGITVTKDGPGLGVYVGNCVLTDSNSAMCNFVNGYSLMAYAAPAQQSNSPSCAWMCDCGQVTITSNDGLPVELMGFSLEENSAHESDEDASQDDEGEAGEENPG